MQGNHRRRWRTKCRSIHTRSDSRCSDCEIGSRIHYWLSTPKRKSAAEWPPTLLGSDAARGAGGIRVSREWLVGYEMLISLDRQTQFSSQFGDLSEADVAEFGKPET